MIAIAVLPQRTVFDTLDPVRLPKISPWLRFFRLPNLPTAPGDALAGAAFMLPAGDATLVRAFAAAAGALLMYMYGLAVNDDIGAREDAENAPGRPIPSGEISIRAARIAGCVCLIAAYWVPELIMRFADDGGEMPFTWSIAMVALCGLVIAYNYQKSAWLLGVCRAASVLCGGIAVWLPDRSPYTGRLFPENSWLLVSLILLAFGWGLYVAAVAKLSEGKDRLSEGLGNRRFLLGLAAFTPLLAFVPIAFMPGVEFESRLMFVMPVSGCCSTFIAWCLAVEPLWMPHGPKVRKLAVDRAISALMYMQIGFMLMVARPSFLAAAAGLWFASRLAHRFAPQINGL